LRASGGDTALGRGAASLSLAALLVLAALGALAVPAHAADDSNSGKLTQAPTVTPEQLSSALSTLSQGTNDTQLQQLLSQFQSQLGSGDYSGASSTLSQLQGLSASQDSGASPPLSALLQSLSVGSDGASVNANTLASLLSQGSGSQSNVSDQALSTDMQSLADLMQYVNSTMASQLLQNSDLLSQSAFAGSGGGSAQSVTLPGVSGFSGLSVPSIGGPSLSVGAPSARIPSVPLADFAVPLAVAGALAALFFSRGRLSRLAVARGAPGLTLLGRGGREEAGDPPADPRKRIEFYFGRAVRLMTRRGVPKAASDTHREFSSMCEGRPERASVSTISSLYERAKFSGQEVGQPEAYLAAASLLAMEREER
jgi:Domain of unknown function (DUF4129)